MLSVAEIVRLAFDLGASDVHLTVGSAPAFRLNGELVQLDDMQLAGCLPAGLGGAGKLTYADTERLAVEIMGEELYRRFCDTGEADFAVNFPGLCRCRVNAYRQRGCTALAVRLINNRIPALGELGLPETVAELARRPRGLVLVTGPTGSGKSTTLAAMVDLINSERRCHIITLEDPIEFVHEHKKSLVNQREIGRDSPSFASALRAAMREDPDVIMVGEMRDPETIATAITAAETGHLVLATLHTASAAQSIDRIIDTFPPHQQQQIKVQLANTIQGVVAQQLLPRLDGAGRVAAAEVMVATPAIRNLIREGKTYQIINHLQTGTKYGMISLDMALRALCLKGVVTKEEALSRAIDPDSLARALF